MCLIYLNESHAEHRVDSSETQLVDLVSGLLEVQTPPELGKLPFYKYFAVKQFELLKKKTEEF